MNNDSLTTERARDPKLSHTLPAWLAVVHQQVGSLKFGTVQITVHDRKVVQIDRNEKMRINSSTEEMPSR
jgi:hypothetical protein